MDRMNGGVKINIGCGRDIREGWLNMDQYLNEGVDVVHDMNRVPLPFPDNYAEHILASHVMEHILHWEDVVADAYRVLAPGGTFEIRVPYKLRGMDSAYHLRFFTPTTMDIFCSTQIADRDAISLEHREHFEKVFVKVGRRFPYRYHLAKYLHIRVRERYMDDAPLLDKVLGRKDEIIWLLRKPNGVKA